MRLLLHAISATDNHEPRVRGLRDRPIVRVDEAGLTAWTTCLDESEAPFDRADLIAEHEIVSALHEQFDACLPARFPTLIDEDELRADFRRRSGELFDGLERVRGRCELAVTAVWLSPGLTEADDSTTGGAAAAGASMSGARYMRERQRALAGSDRRRERARDLADELEGLVGRELLGAKRTVCPSAAVAFSIAVLVPRVTADVAKARLARTEADVRILVNGPWPPYTFASA